MTPNAKNPPPAVVTIGGFNAEASVNLQAANPISPLRLIGAILITLLGPGAGHLFLKMKKRGWLIMGVATLYLVGSLTHLMSLMLKSMEEQKKKLAGGDPSEVSEIVQKFYIHFMQENSGIISLYEWLGTFLFVGSIADLIYLYWKRVRPSREPT